MATFSITLTVGGTSVTKTMSPTNARTVQFLDDLIAHQYTDEVDDGAGGTRPRTRDEVADHYLAQMMSGVHGMAKRVAQMRLDLVKAVGTDLDNN